MLASTRFVIPLIESHLARPDRVGEKARNLAILAAGGLSVPEGWVLVSDAFASFKRLNGLSTVIAHELSTYDRRSYASACTCADRLRALILGAQMPATIEAELAQVFDRLGCDCVAVRSSSLLEDRRYRSGAGLLHTMLNVGRSALNRSVLEVWASVYSPQILWRQHAAEDVPCALIIQVMINAEVAGVAFSLDPITRSDIVIEAHRGAGDEDERGNERRRRRIRVQRDKLSSVDLMSTKKISVFAQVAKVITKAERILGHSIDMEWAALDDSLYVLQGRPIIETSTDCTDRVRAANYILLWRTTYCRLLSSIYLESGYYEGDFIAVQHGAEHALFACRVLDERTRSKALYYLWSDFDIYRTSVHSALERFDEIFRRTNGPLESEADAQIIFQQCIDVSMEIWRWYFFLEEHCADWLLRECLNGLVDSAHIDLLARLKFDMRTRLDQIPHMLAFSLTTIETSRSLPSGSLMSLSWREVRRLIRGSKIECPADLALEIRGRFSRWRPVRGPTAQQLWKRLTYATLHDTPPVLTGEVASRGWHAGNVVVLHGIHGEALHTLMANLRPGDVLVAGSTGPEVLRACRIAGAIVTDEGGVLSHASLIARELNVPTVIATRVATQVLRTGMWVEVDATGEIGQIYPSKLRDAQATASTTLRAP